MDVRLAGAMDGIDATVAIRAFSDPRIIFCTGSTEDPTVERIKRLKPFEILFKSVDPDLLGTALLKP